MSEKENGLAGWQKAIQELSNYEPTDKYVLAIHRIKQLEQDIAEAKKSIKSVIQHYEDDKVYFERHGEAFYTDSFEI